MSGKDETPSKDQEKTIKKAVQKSVGDAIVREIKDKRKKGKSN